MKPKLNMAYKIEYQTLAETTYLNNITYLENNWPLSVLIKFIKKVESITELLKENPEMFSKWKNNSSIRRVVIVSQITLFYQINKNTVEILLFWNNYQNPESLIKFIK